MAGIGPKSDVPVLPPNTLFDKRRERDGARLKAYNKILEQIYSRIKTSSREGGDPWIIFSFPPFVLVFPRKYLEDCIVYLVYMLRAQGYEVRYTYPNLLYISWKHHEKDYILKGSPIMQSMLASQNTKPKNELRGQSATRVRFADQIMSSYSQQPGQMGSQFGLGGGRQTTMGRAPPKRVETYEPPTSFLDAVEKGAVAEPRKEALNDFLNF
jgi:hypothetical protein